MALKAECPECKKLVGLKKDGGFKYHCVKIAPDERNPKGYRLPCYSGTRG